MVLYHFPEDAAFSGPKLFPQNFTKFPLLKLGGIYRAPIFFCFLGYQPGTPPPMGGLGGSVPGGPNPLNYGFDPKLTPVIARAPAGIIAFAFRSAP